MALRRFLGLGQRTDRARAARSAPREASTRTDTETIRRIVAAMEALDPEHRRFVAGFAYVLGRAAHADLHISPEEERQIERTITDLGGITEAEAVLITQIARSQNELYGGTEDYLVTREFREHSRVEQRIALLRCCFLVASAEGSISAHEGAELNQIAKELDIDDEQLNAIRGEFTDHFEAIQRMRRSRGGS